jgi:hypothetical protein
MTVERWSTLVSQLEDLEMLESGAVAPESLFLGE